MTLCKTSAQALQELIDETVSALAARWQEETQAHFPEHQHAERQISTCGRTHCIAVTVDAEDGTFSDEQLSELASVMLKQTQTKQSCPPPPPPVQPVAAIKSSASKQELAEECKRKHGNASKPDPSKARPTRHVKDPDRPIGAAPPKQAKANAAQREAAPPRAAQHITEHRGAPPRAASTKSKAGKGSYVPITPRGSAGGYKASEKCGAANASNARSQGMPHLPPPPPPRRAKDTASERKASAISASRTTPSDWKEQSARGWEADKYPSSTAEAWTHPSTSWEGTADRARPNTWREGTADRPLPSTWWDGTAHRTWDPSSTDDSGTNDNWYKPDEVEEWHEELEGSMSETEMWENYDAWEREQQEKHRESGLERNQWIHRSQDQKRTHVSWHEDQQPRKNLKQRFNKHVTHCVRQVVLSQQVLAIVSLCPSDQIL